MILLRERIRALIPDRLLPPDGWIFLLYLGIVAAAIPGEAGAVHRVVYLLYAAFIFRIVWPLLRTRPDSVLRASDDHIASRILPGLVLFAALFFVLSRLAPFIRYGATPLGYDTGFYWQYFHLIAPAGKIGHTIGTNHLAYTLWFPLSMLGLGAVPTISILHVFYQLLTLGAFYFLVCSLPLGTAKKSVATMSVFLLAISINQYMAYWWMFYKQSMAIPFLLIGLALFLRRHWLALPLAAVGAGIHLYPAVAFAIAGVLYLLCRITVCLVRREPIERDVWVLTLSGTVAVILLLLLKGSNDIRDHLTYLLRFGGIATSGKSWEVQQAKGLFLPFSTFHLNTLFYLPFALIGVFKAKSWMLKSGRPRMTIIPLLAFTALVLGFFPFLYQNRALIVLDLLVILFAAYPLWRFIDYERRQRLGTVMIALLLVGSALFSARVVWAIEPQLYSSEAQELDRLRVDATDPIRAGDDYVMATTSLYTPWAYAYSDFSPTIAPGWLTWDKWDINEWRDFWIGSSDERRLALLRKYGDHKIFMFVGSHQIVSPALKNFLETNPHMSRVSPHVWRYSPASPNPMNGNTTL